MSTMKTAVTRMGITTPEAKKHLRQQMIALRESTSPADLAAWSMQLADQLEKLLQPEGLLALAQRSFMHDMNKTSVQMKAPVAALYASMRQEANLAGVIPLLLERGWQIAYPRVEKSGDIPALQFWALPEKANLQWDDYFCAGPFGLTEPDPLKTEVCEPDVIFLPGLAFDRQGNRLGWGKGYYDRYLSSPHNKRSLLIGVALPFQLVPLVPTAPHDILLDAVLTPDGLIPTPALKI